jgi:exodeoxyribonuclease VII small subunit
MKEQNFEVKLNELEGIVKNLESGDLNLDDSINKFEEGVELYKNCQSLLVKAEKKIQVLTDSLKEEDYSSDE